MDRNSIKIAITSVGGGVGQSILKALRAANYTTVAMDADPLAAGLYASPISYLVPHSNNKNYITELLRICKKEHCKLLFPGSDTELLILAQSKRLFAKVGTQVVVSAPEVIKLADDKLLTFQTLSEAGLSAPQTQMFNDFVKKPQLSYPVVLKPRIGGSRSQNVKVVASKEELDQAGRRSNFRSDNTVVQEYIEGDEYTCGSVTLDGTCYGVIVMRRILRDGDTYKCFSEKNSSIEQFVKRVVEHIQPFGACNIQLRLKNGQPLVFEINARCSGTTAARALSGFNEPASISDYLCFHKKPRFKIRELTILRYWKELVVENSEIATLDSKKKSIKKAAHKL